MFGRYRQVRDLSIVVLQYLSIHLLCCSVLFHLFFLASSVLCSNMTICLSRLFYLLCLFYLAGPFLLLPLSLYSTLIHSTSTLAILLLNNMWWFSTNINCSPAFTPYSSARTSSDTLLFYYSTVLTPHTSVNSQCIWLFYLKILTLSVLLLTAP